MDKTNTNLIENQSRIAHMLHLLASFPILFIKHSERLITTYYLCHLFYLNFMFPSNPFVVRSPFICFVLRHSYLISLMFLANYSRVYNLDNLILQRTQHK